MSSKSSSATLCHFKNSKFSFTKTSRWKFFDLKPTHFAVIVPQQRNLVRGCCTLKIHPPKSVNTLNSINVFFWNCINDLSDTVDLRICGRFQFFYRKSANVCGKKSVRKAANQNLKFAICGFADLRTGLRKCPALEDSSLFFHQNTGLRKSLEFQN